MLKGCVAMPARQRPQAVRRQERVLGQDLPEHLLEMDRGQQAQHQPLPVRARSPASRAARATSSVTPDVARNRAKCLPSVAPSCAAARGTVSARQDRQQPDHGVDLERHPRCRRAVAARRSRTRPSSSHRPDRLMAAGDPDRVLQERGHQVRVRRVALRQDRGHPQHRQAVGVHPGRRVGLLQGARHRQVGPVEGAQVVEAQEAAREQVAAVARPRG